MWWMIRQQPHACTKLAIDESIIWQSPLYCVNVAAECSEPLRALEDVNAKHQELINFSRGLIDLSIAGPVGTLYCVIGLEFAPFPGGSTSGVYTSAQAA